MTLPAEIQTLVEGRDTRGLARSKTSQAKGGQLIRSRAKEICGEKQLNLRPSGGEFLQPAAPTNPPRPAAA